jgi:outer membrane protein TolC
VAAKYTLRCGFAAAGAVILGLAILSPAADLSDDNRSLIASQPTTRQVASRPVSASGPVTTRPVLRSATTRPILHLPTTRPVVQPVTTHPSLQQAATHPAIPPVTTQPALQLTATQPSLKPATTQPTSEEAMAQLAVRLESSAVMGQIKGTKELTVSQAILMALENNKALIVQKYNPDISSTAVDVQRAVFDPDLTASFTLNRQQTDRGGENTVSRSATGNIGLSEFLPTGTQLDLSLSTDATFLGDNQYTSNANLTVTQSLLRGFGIDVNLVNLRQAKINVLTTRYELRGFSETMVSSVEKAYWDYALSHQETQIVIQSLHIAENQLADTQERVRVGKLAGSQLAASEADVALRREDLINARAAEATARLALVRLISPSDGDAFQYDILLVDRPAAIPVELGSVDQHVQTAMRQRPDLNQARLQINSGELQIVQTRNGLLPQLNLFISLGKTGYADSFGPSWKDVVKGRSSDVEAGVSFELPPLNRAAKANFRNSVLSHDQDIAALDNLSQLAEQDVRTAYISVLQAREQVTATAATRKAQEETLRAETARFQAEKSTSLLVSVAQRDLLTARVNEVRAVVAYLEALVDLYRLEGSLLERRGIVAPGGAPVELVPLSWK